MRIIKPQPPKNYDGVFMFGEANFADKNFHHGTLIKPKYRIGDRVYCKEGYQIDCGYYGINTVYGKYLADNKTWNVKKLTTREMLLWDNRQYPNHPTSGRFMYKSLARIWLPEITSIEVKRPQDLTPQEILNEGIETFGWEYAESSDGSGDEFLYWTEPTKEMPLWCPESATSCECIEEVFSWFWNALHGKDAWERNEWCFRYNWKDIELKE